MIETTLKRLGVFIFYLLLLLPGSALKAEDRFFDRAEMAAEDVRLVVFYPSAGTLQQLIALKENGLLDFSGLTVIGVFHAKEKTDYEASLQLAEEKNLGWLKFHRITTDISADVVFQKNACTPEFEKIFGRADGMIFFGGPDIPPYLYNRKTKLLTEIEDPYRHFMELSFIFHLLGGFQDEGFKPLLESRPRFPVFGICLGAQSLNVGTGGTLTQDIWTDIYGVNTVEDAIALGQEQWHTSPFRRLYPEKKLFPYWMHPILLKKGGRFCGEMGFPPEARLYILSAHHQQIDRPGKGFRVSATSLDGKVVEAMEHEKYGNVLGVQFHPEFPMLYSPDIKFRMRPEDKEETSLKAFLDKYPPSMEFHKKIWSWFSRKLREAKKK